MGYIPTQLSRHAYGGISQRKLSHEITSNPPPKGKYVRITTADREADRDTGLQTKYRNHLARVRRGFINPLRMYFKWSWFPHVQVLFVENQHGKVIGLSFQGV